MLGSCCLPHIAPDCWRSRPCTANADFCAPAAGYWSSWTETARDDPEFKAYLGLEPEDRCLGIFMLGSCSERVAGYRASRGPIEEKVRWMA